MPVPSIRCSRHIFAGKCLSCLHRTLFSPQTLLTAWTWWQCRCWWSSAALWYLPGRLLPSIPGHSFGCHIDSSCFLFRGLYRNINLSKANTDSVLSHKCSICCGVFFWILFIQQCNVCIRCHQHGVYRVRKKEFVQFIRHKYIRHPWCLGSRGRPPLL